MSKNNNQRYRGVTIKSPADVRRITRRVISDIFAEGSQIENAGKVNQLLQTWLRGWELEKISDLEERIMKLEREKEGRL